MKSDADLDRVANQIYWDLEHGPNDVVIARGRLQKLVKCELSDAFDEIEKRAEAAMLKDRQLEGKHYAALRSLRIELGIERKLGSVACGPKG